MAIKLSELKVLQEGERKIRKSLDTPQGTIEIYEPTVTHADIILDLQRGANPDFVNQKTLTLDGKTVLKQLFPLLTNISFEEMSDEEIEDVIENPSIHLLITQKFISQIVSEVNKLYTEHIRDEISKADSMLAQTELIESIPAMIIEQAKRNPELAEIAKKAETSKEEFDRRVAKEQSKFGEPESKITVMPTEIRNKVGKTEYE